MVDLDRSINVATKSGQTKFGVKQAIKAAKNGDALAIVVAENAPVEFMEDVTRYAGFSDVPIIIYPKSSQDLGIACGRPHLTAFVTIFDAGDSDIMQAVA